MKKLFALLFSAAFTISMIACNNNQKKDPANTASETKKDSTGVTANRATASSAGVNYSITAPDGWTKSDTTISGSVVTRIMSPLENPGDNFRENLNIVSEKAEGYDHVKYTEANLATLKSDLNDCNIISNDETTIGSIPANAVVYTFIYQGYNLKNTAYFLVHNDRGYVITCTTVNNKFDKYQSYFKPCVNSFKFSD